MVGRLFETHLFVFLPGQMPSPQEIDVLRHLGTGPADNEFKGPRPQLLPT